MYFKTASWLPLSVSVISWGTVEKSVDRRLCLQSSVPSPWRAIVSVAQIPGFCWESGRAVCILIGNSSTPSFTLIKTPERGREIGSVKNGWRGERGRARITGDRQNILRQTWLRKGDRRGGEIIKQNASAAAVLQISCQVPGPHSEIAGVRKTARETWREISRELKGQNTMSSHQGGGQSQVFTSTSPISA